MRIFDSYVTAMLVYQGVGINSHKSSYGSGGIRVEPGQLVDVGSDEGLW